MKRIVPLLFLAFLLAALPLHAQSQPPKPAAPDEFVPVNAPISPQDTIPAPRLVAIAYGFIWVVLFGYLVSVKTRLSKVEHEIEAVGRRAGSAGRTA